VLGGQPGIINYSSGGLTFGAILHADYSLATPANPVTAGETVLIYGTGLGLVSTAQVDGTAANGESTIALPSVTIGGASAMVTFSGLAPGFVGLNQVNVMVPSGLATGNQPVVMNVGGVASNSVLLPVR
jgi:adhesin/invasin